MARKRPGPRPIKPPRRPGHPPLTTPSGRFVMYMICSAGTGRGQVAISGYFSVAPGTSKGDVGLFMQDWLLGKLAAGGSDVNRFPDFADWSCDVQGSLGTLPVGSAEVRIP